MPIPEHVSMGEFGAQLLPDLYVVSWLGMSAPKIDCHVYVIRGSDGLLLIDGGTPWGHKRLKANMEHWGLDLRNVQTVLFTHGHVDHVSGAYHFKAQGAELLAHRSAHTTIAMQWQAQDILDEDSNGYSLDGSLGDGYRLNRCGFDIDVYHTPGHSAGCLSFLITVNGVRCLFSGDLIMGDGMPGWAGDPDHDREAIVCGMTRLRALPFAHLCYGHGVIMDDHGQLFAAAINQESTGEWDHPNSRYPHKKGITSHES